MRQVTLFLLLILIGASPNGEAWSQAASPSLQDQINAAAELAARVNTAARLRVRTVEVQAEVERPRLMRDSLSWRTAAATSLRSGRTVQLAQPLALAEVTRIELRSNHAGRGALIGGGIGAALGVAAAIALNSDEFFGPLSVGDVVLVTAVPTVGGALLGGLVGAAVPRWQTVYHQTEPR